MIRPLLGIVLVTVLVLPIVSCQPAAGNPEGQAPQPSPTKATLAAEDATTVPPSPTPEEAVETLPSARPERESVPTKAPTSGVVRSDPQAAELVQAAREDLSDRLGVPEGEIGVKSVEAIDWPDAGLGCPLPGMVYAQVVTPGYRVVLEAHGQTHEYHTDTSGQVVLCQPESATQMPFPKGIKDGQPWLPVEPIEPDKAFSTPGQ